MSGDLTRVTVNLTPRASAALERINQGGISKTDAINRGILLLDLMEKLMDDGIVAVRDGEGNYHRIYLL